MIKLKSFIFLAFIALATTLSSASASSIIYNWTGENGSGSITFFDTNIVDPENFSVAFTTENVADISYTFENGTSIGDADGFSTASTLQSLDELGTGLFSAVNGVIENWTFNYVSVVSVTPLPIGFVDSSLNFTVSCIINPCPADSAIVNFVGNFSSESNSGNWELQPVPVPAAVWLFGSSLIGLVGMAKRRKA